MKFIAKEQREKVEVGDVIEYRVTRGVVRLMIVRGFDDEGVWRYKLLDFKDNQILKTMYDDSDDIFYTYKGFEGFRIIKSENLELREV